MGKIDAEPIIKNLSAMKTQFGYDAIAIDGMIKALREADEDTALEPPNDPLTLEDLREMDGEPVWVERSGYEKGWALVQVWAKSTNVIYLIQPNGLVLYPQVEHDCGGKVYRRKPEGGGENV